MTHRWSCAGLAAAVYAIAIGCSSGTGAPPRTASAPPAAPPAGPPPAAPAAAPPPAAPAHDYPATRRDAVVDQLHGVAVRDPYRWLEDATRPEVQDWMKAQDGYTRAQLARLPGREALAARLAEVFYFDSIGVPRHRGGRYFFTRRQKDQEKERVYWKQGETGKDQLLLDPNTWSTDGSAGLAGWWPSDDGRYVAYNATEHNADEATLHILDVATGKPLLETIAGTKYGGAWWTPDSRAFYYVRLPPPSPQVAAADRPGYAELRYHALGTDPAKDPTVREANHDAQTSLGGSVSHDGHWLFSTVTHGWNSTNIYFRDLRKHQQDWTALVEGVPAHFTVEAYGDAFYVLTDDGARRYRMFAVDPTRPVRAAWREIVGETDATLESFAIVGGHLVLDYLRNAASELVVHDLHGKRIRTLDVPPLGSASRMFGLPDEDTAYFSYVSFTEAQVIYKASIRRTTAPRSRCSWSTARTPSATARRRPT
jgi:prolyl oligopeptidase